METIGGASPVPATKISDSNVALVVVAVVFQFLSTVAVALRFSSRTLSQSVSWDDWASLVALVFAYGNTITVILCATIGRAGYHLVQYTEHQLTTYLKSVLAYVITLVCSVSWSKFALLWFYRRIFPVRSMKVPIWILTAVTTAYWLGMIFSLVFSNHPVESQWKPWIPHTGLDWIRLYQAVTVIDMLIDMAILCLPMPLVWKLQVPFRRKFLISILFLVGSFTCITNAIRLVYVRKIHPLDFTYDLAMAGIWASVELHLSIICGCVPTFPRLLRFWRERRAPLSSSTASTAKLESGTTGSSLSRSQTRHDSHDQTWAKPVGAKIGYVRSESDKDEHLRHVDHVEHAVHVRTDIEIQNIERTYSNDGNFMGRW